MHYLRFYFENGAVGLLVASDAAKPPVKSQPVFHIYRLLETHAIESFASNGVIYGPL